MTLASLSDVGIREYDKTPALSFVLHHNDASTSCCQLMNESKLDPSKKGDHKSSLSIAERNIPLLPLPDVPKIMNILPAHPSSSATKKN